MRCLGWHFVRVRPVGASSLVAIDLPLRVPFWSHSTDLDYSCLRYACRDNLAKVLLRFAFSRNQNAVAARSGFLNTSLSLNGESTQDFVA
jgi:hypothetical protein